MRFLADIQIGRITLDYLRSLGHDAISVRERLPANAPDVEILRVATTERRIVLCFDLGFSELVALSRKVLPSVITFRTARRRAAYINKRLEAILPQAAAELERGALVTVEDSCFRSRPLPAQ